jgi:hypothetical protein
MEITIGGKSVTKSRYVFIASMDIATEREAIFNAVYDEEHIPALLTVPGVQTASRFRTRVSELVIGGERRRIPLSAEPTYHAVFELDTPDVLTSDAWARAVELGRWPSAVRPWTRNRRHIVIERLTAMPRT